MVRLVTTFGESFRVSDLKSRIANLIRADGPMSISTYMQLCLHDPRDGYYATRPGLGTDFTTAPEISQIFGELLGLWAVHEWQQMGQPEQINLVELGPGRATLMSDALRASATVPGFHEAMQLILIEASPALRTLQAERLSAHHVRFETELTALPSGPTLILANEYLDCLPAQQYIREGEDWRERVIGLDADGNLGFGLAAEALPVADAPDLDAIEVQPALKTLIDQIAQLVERGDPVCALFIDYGPVGETPSDTLRAFQNGEQIHPLAAPGESDLTVDVDFDHLRGLAHAAGLSVYGPVPQGSFLLRLGAEARLNQLAKLHPDKADDLYDGIRELVDPDQMGTRFNAIAIGNAALPKPAAF
ncbi:MAG: SAM-dependent methyltransferase [Henriciella sp.]|nr:SAM-dependent methyltransferase [Henriciella sp.]